MLNITRPGNVETHSVIINFGSSYLKVSEQINLTNLSNFISAVGGNLGLFIGFSVLPFLLKVIEYIWHLKFNDMFTIGIK